MNWQKLDPETRLREAARITDRGTLESIVQGDAPPDVRRIAAERLFKSDHVRTHARRPVREAALEVIEDRDILRAIADVEAEPRLRARALHKLGDLDAVRPCGICGEINLASVERCACGFNLATGDLPAAKQACAEARRGATSYLVSGAAILLLAFVGGMSLLPVYVTFTLQVGTHRVDLVLLFAGLALIVRGRRIRARPWTAAAF